MGDRSLIELYLAGMTAIAIIVFPIMGIYTITQIFDFGSMTVWNWLALFVILPLIVSCEYIALRFLKWLLYRRHGDGDKIVYVCLVCYLLPLIAVVLAFAGVPKWASALVILIWIALLFGFALYSLVNWFKLRPVRAKERRERQQGDASQQAQGQRAYGDPWRQAYGQSGGQQGQQGDGYANDNRAKSSGADADNPFEILGIAEIASEDEARAAHRDKCMLWHPDRLTQKQKEDPKFRQFAHDEMSRINTAWEEIKKRKGWK